MMINDFGKFVESPVYTKHALGNLNVPLKSSTKQFLKKEKFPKWLTHLFLMHLFSTPWKHQKTLRFSDVFGGYRKDALGTIGLSSCCESWLGGAARTPTKKR